MKIVAAALIVRNGKIFIAQRPAHKLPPLHWEFPGGKQEPGETLPEALRRELNEELNINAKIGDFFMKSSYDYEFGSFEINCFWATVPDNVEIISEEHAATAWASPEELANYTFTPADIPIIEALAKVKL